MKLDSLAAECKLGFDVNEPHFTLPLARILSLKFHPSEPWLFAAAKRSGTDGMACPVHMIGTASGQIILTFDVVANSPDHEPVIEEMLLTANGATLVVGTRADGLHVFDLLDGSALPRHRIDVGGSRAFQLAHDGSRSLLAVTMDTSRQAEIRAIVLTSGSETNYRHLGQEVASAVFATDIARYLICTENEILFLNSQTLVTEQSMPVRFPGILSYHGRRIVLSCRDAVTVFDAGSLHKSYELEPPPSGFSKSRWDGQISFTPGGEYITLSDNERSQLHVWSAVDGRYQTSYSARTSFQLRLCSDFSGSGLMAISGGTDIAIARVSKPDTEYLCDSPCYIRAMDIDRVSQCVVVLREASAIPQDYRVEIYDRLKLSSSFAVENIPDYHQPSICLGPKGDWVAIAIEKERFSTEILVYATATGEEIARTRPLAAFRCMEATEDGQLVIAAESGVTVWEPPFSVPLADTVELEDDVNLIVQIDPSQLLVGNEAGLINKWTIDTGKSNKAPFALSQSPLTVSALSGDGGLLAIGDSRGAISIVEPNDLRKVSKTDAHWSGVLAMIWLDDGLLVSSGRDQTLRFWLWCPSSDRLELQLELWMPSNVVQIFANSTPAKCSWLWLLRENSTAVERLNANLMSRKLAGQ